MTKSPHVDTTASARKLREIALKLALDRSDALKITAPSTAVTAAQIFEQYLRDGT